MTVVRGRKPKHWHWKDVMRSMLEKQDDKGSFGDVLANILILPALLGRSLVNLSDLSCPPGKYGYFFTFVTILVSIPSDYEQLSAAPCMTGGNCLDNVKRVKKIPACPAVIL